MGFPMLPPFFFNVGEGLKGSSSPTIHLNSMEHFLFFPPVNLSYRHSFENNKLKKMQLGITYYQVPIHYSTVSVNTKPVSYYFINAGFLRKINKNNRIDFSFGYDLFLAYINSQSYASSGIYIKDMSTNIAGIDIGFSLATHITKNFFIQVEQYLLVGWQYNNGTIVQNRYNENVINYPCLLSPKLFGINFGYRFN